MDIIGHFKTITYHKWLVMKGCFKLGLYKQGILHDMSKYSPTEFFIGAKFYQGTRSPNNAEREDKGYSLAWIHHYGRNKHHYEYWSDYIPGTGKMGPVEMPVKYAVEMFVDRVCASKVYNKEAYRDDSPLKYYENSKAKDLIHPNTAAFLEKLLKMLAKDGEEKTFRHIRKVILKNYK